MVLIHCETGTGVLNPLAEVAAVCERHGKGLIVDAMSSFGALPIDARSMRFDALVAASGKCLEGVPGMGFVFLRKAILDGCAGNSQSLAMDLFDQYQYMEKTTQWRFTPPTHVMVALAEAVAQFVEEGGQPARLARYQDNCKTLIDGLTALGLKPFLKPRAAGADHRHLVCARAPGLRLQALLCRGQAARLHPVPGQAHRGGNLPRRLHRRHRCCSGISLIYWFGNQGCSSRGSASSASTQIYGAPGIVMAEMLLAVPACADDPGDGADRRRRAAVRGRRRHGHLGARASSGRSRCPVPSTG